MLAPIGRSTIPLLMLAFTTGECLAAGSGTKAGSETKLELTAEELAEALEAYVKKEVRLKGGHFLLYDTDAEVARLMNESFISIKVDREERPDIDSIYMRVCPMMTGGGGWPLTIIMTPYKKPFFAGTYFPKQTRFGRTGLIELLSRISEIWKTRRADIAAAADQITEALQRTATESPGGELDMSTLASAFQELSQRFDPTYGGFGAAPKFPTPQNLLFLLRYWRRTGEQSALEMVERTLKAMRLGGIYDHIGFGFHRYSTDRRWFVPHFEKMLYDQALIAMADTEALLKVLRGAFVPNKVVLFRPAGEGSPSIGELAPFTRRQKAIGGRAAAYVCLGYLCKRPTTEPAEMLELLGLK